MSVDEDVKVLDKQITSVNTRSTKEDVNSLDGSGIFNKYMEFLNDGSFQKSISNILNTMKDDPEALPILPSNGGDMDEVRKQLKIISKRLSRIEDALGVDKTKKKKS